MKSIAFITLVFAIPVITFSQRVEFVKETWQEINDRAAKEQKFIFVDAYTEWCGWCKILDQEMFTDPKVATYINENFIPVKIDFEDSLGIILAMKFRVSGYPTSLVFNNYGQLTGKFSGYTDDHDRYLEFLVKNREIREERVFGYDSRDLDLPYPDFYEKAFLTGKDRKWPSDSVVNAYLKEQPDFFSEVCWSVLVKFKPKAYEDHVLDNLEKYGAIYGKDETQDYIQSIVYRYIRIAVDSTDKDYLVQALKLSEKLDNPEDQKAYILMTYSERVKDWPGFVGALGAYIDRNGSGNHMFINNNCWTIYENSEDPETLKKAAGWMKPVIEAEPDWMYLDTYAALLYKSGNLEEALKYAELAIEAGIKEEQDDISETKALRDKIQAELDKTK